ncbi:MAG: DUF3365 domain-containing protein [Deltaproteobacteria bacterium]|nr:DUF3365 domain-containing protein [Deltaproteobacteria bacterium]
MRNRPARFSLTVYLNLILSIFFILASVVVVFLVREAMRKQALVEAQAKAMILLDRNMATHDYFTNKLKPAVFALSEKYRPADHFDPTWMSSTYANRGIDQYFNERNKGKYYFKNCAINARTPTNEADPHERAFIQALNANPSLQVRSDIMRINGQPFFVVLRRGETMLASCLICHSTPEHAPKGLVDIYGPTRSFGRSLGEVISAVSIRIPMSEAYAEADRFTWGLSGLLIFVLFAMYLAQLFLNRALILGPLQMIRDKARLIAEDEAHLGEKIELPTSKEFQDVAAAFNTMSENLRHQKDHLEERVQDRTKELTLAMAKVKTLKGLLPICASCKKIRDDQGYWTQIENYIHKHSDAEFSHGICPDCAKKLYPEIFPADTPTDTKPD